MTTIRKWPKILKTLTSNASSSGVIEVESVSGLYLFQKIFIKSDLESETKDLQIIEFLSTTKVRLGKFSSENKRNIIDLSSYLFVDNTFISAPEQRMTNDDYKDIIQETFERFPIDAWRVINVDDKGSLISPSNPLPVQISPISVPFVINLNITNANTETSFTLTDETKKFSFKVRDGGAKTKLSYVSGQSGSIFWTIDRGSTYTEEGLSLTGKTIYFQLSKSNQVVEIKYWE